MYTLRTMSGKHTIYDHFAFIVAAVVAVGCGGRQESTTPSDASGNTGGIAATGGSNVSPPAIAEACAAPLKAADVATSTVVGTGEGTCTESKLDAALAMGGNITFNCGVVVLPLGSEKTISKATVIDGGGKVTLSGGGKHRLFKTMGEVDFTVQNITLADAMVKGARGIGPSSANSGAAIYRQSNARLVVVEVTFKNNHATESGNDIAGGAIFSYGGDTIVVGSTFDGNSAASGGAIGNLRSNLTIVNSTFVNNRARTQNGGAMALDGQNMDRGKVFTLCGVVVQNNTAQKQAGGVYRYGYAGESTIIDNSTFDGNTAQDSMEGLGGGLYLQTDDAAGMPLKMSNSTVSNNKAGRGAGAMFLFNVPPTMTNVTIANNSALKSLGGGIAGNNVTGTLKNCTIASNHADNGDSFGGGIIGGKNLTLINTIVANNTAGNAYNPVSCTDVAKGGQKNLQFPDKTTAGKAEPACVPGVTFADPRLGPLQDNGGGTKTMALLEGSPAVGMGADCPAKDQRGKLRMGRCDLGAFQKE